jgi:pyruvate/2-oxoglutarate dehydrogenase complex dihydrolipoamide dehydrogenase (E3) component
MAFDYDLVIIGGTAAAREAALRARFYKARVALVEPEPYQEEFWVGSECWWNQALVEIGHIAQGMRRGRHLGLQLGPPHDSVDYYPLVTDWDAAMQWAKVAVATWEERRSPAMLAASGVDVVFGNGMFCHKPWLFVRAGDRQLRARTYLIATGSQFTVPKIEGMATAQPLTPDVLWKANPSFQFSTKALLNTNTDVNVDASPHSNSSPESATPTIMIVIGDEPQSVELAQAFARLGRQVTLVVSSAHVLPREDADASRLIQAQLEAEGINVLTQTTATQVKELQGKKWVQVGDRALEADEILLTTRQPQTATLNLEEAGIACQHWGIQVNSKLQTTNSRVYACGEVMGGYPFAHIAEYEARIAVRNALFFPWCQVNYQHVPWAIFTDPTLARVGLTEVQARRRYGSDVLVLRQYFKTVLKAHIRGETTGFCKLIVRRNGKIVGAHMVGAEAEELIGAIALTMQNRLSVQDLANLPAIAPSLSAITQYTAAEWQYQKLKANPLLQNLLKRWFNSRRG